MEVTEQRMKTKRVKLQISVLSQDILMFYELDLMSEVTTWTATESQAAQ